MWKEAGLHADAQRSAAFTSVSGSALPFPGRRATGGPRNGLRNRSKEIHVVTSGGRYSRDLRKLVERSQRPPGKAETMGWGDALGAGLPVGEPPFRPCRPQVKSAQGSPGAVGGVPLLAQESFYIARFMDGKQSMDGPCNLATFTDLIKKSLKLDPGSLEALHPPTGTMPIDNHVKKDRNKPMVLKKRHSPRGPLYLSLPLSSNLPTV
ncbi:uncharacterized protein [Macaca nemestrina]|uniref:uncharacterized protein isoform X1 n=1 Tax=Macaca nemestrina TaxID=9545 RepID=UPI0039B98631